MTHNMMPSSDPDRSPLDHDHGADRIVHAALEFALSSEPAPEPPMRPKEIGAERSPRAKLGRLAAHYGLNSDIELRPESAKGLPQPKKHEQSPLTYTRPQPRLRGPEFLQQPRRFHVCSQSWTRRSWLRPPACLRLWLRSRCGGEFPGSRQQQDGAGMMRGSDRL